MYKLVYKLLVNVSNTKMNDAILKQPFENSQHLQIKVQTTIKRAIIKNCKKLKGFQQIPGIKKLFYSGDLNSELVRYSNGPK